MANGRQPQPIPSGNDTSSGSWEAERLAKQDDDFLAIELGQFRVCLEELKARSLSSEDVADIRQYLSYMRAYSAAATVLKSVALWIVAMAAAWGIISGVFVDLIKSAIARGGPHS